ncbi:uncharacterized protein A4U43_UnF9620 [Asparagus officinalis]|uniref:Homeobox domain-containing protein n=2 Tax=Asparagus officinalis TaxID=4686 RepID=A0A1R3L5N5_ASPOF|nr:uncharacterized protein A4U43_UnF9620 [Asparagus officinalis]
MRLVHSQKELFHSQIDQLQRIVVAQCKLTGANPLSQEMAAGALSIKIGKRPRDLLNPKAVKYMQLLFSIKDTFGKKELREISALCGITVTQVRDYFSNQRSKVRKLVRLSHEKASECDEFKSTVDECSVSPKQLVPASKDIPASTSDLSVVGDYTHPPVSGNSTYVCTRSPAFPENAISNSSQLLGNPNNFTPICPQILREFENFTTMCTQAPGYPGNVSTVPSQVPGYSGNVNTVPLQVPGYSGNFTSLCEQVPGTLGNFTSVSAPVTRNSGNVNSVATPVFGYPGIVTSVRTFVPGSLLDVTPIQDAQPAPVKTDPKPVEGGPSCSSLEEATPGVDSDDKMFVEDIFNLMRKEQTFSGHVKLMEWVLKIDNPSVLSWFSTKGGISILATWLSDAALEEQTTVLLVLFKVLCHLPLQKAQPAQMSAILQTVNTLRFYRNSDISNRAKVLLSRWSKMFVRTQRNRNSLKNGQRKMNQKQRPNGIVDDVSWESKLDIPEDILALAQSAEDSRETEPKKALKLLTDSSDGSTRKHGLSVSATKNKERRKVQLVEPDNKAGRSGPATRAVPSNNSRPMSTDDIQKAKMRASFMQEKYGKSNSPPATETTPPKTEDHKAPSENKTPQLPQLRKNEVKKPPVLASKNSSHKSENIRNLTPQEQMLEKIKKNQIQWRMPPEVTLSSTWRVGAGENSKEVQGQTERNKRGKETFYQNPQQIPPNPKDPWDVEMDFDDSLTPEIPIDQVPDSDTMAVEDQPSTSAAPVTTGDVDPQTDAELLQVLLKNPDVVLALTKGEGKNFSDEQLVALLDMVKQAGTGSAGLLNGHAARVPEPEPEPVSLPSPTPPSDAARITAWRSEFPSHATTSFSQSQFVHSSPTIPTILPPTPSPVMPTAINQAPAMVTVNPHTNSLPTKQPSSLYKQPSLYTHPYQQQSRAPETMISSNHYPVNHPQLPIYSQPKTPAIYPGNTGTNSNYYADPNPNNYNVNSHSIYPPRRNEYAARGGLGSWSPEDSPAVVRNSSHGRDYYPEFDRSREWSRQRQWDSGHRNLYPGGGGRSWRDRDRGR